MRPLCLLLLALVLACSSTSFNRDTGEMKVSTWGSSTVTVASDGQDVTVDAKSTGANVVPILSGLWTAVAGVFGGGKSQDVVVNVPASVQILPQPAAPAVPAGPDAGPE